MTLIGDTMIWEQTGPKQLVRDVALAEEASFDSPSCGISWRAAQVGVVRPVARCRRRVTSW
jgi:hypothetical protein